MATVNSDVKINYCISYSTELFITKSFDDN